MELYGDASVQELKRVYYSGVMTLTQRLIFFFKSMNCTNRSMFPFTERSWVKSSDD